MHAVHFQVKTCLTLMLEILNVSYILRHES